MVNITGQLMHSIEVLFITASAMERDTGKCWMEINSLAVTSTIRNKDTDSIIGSMVLFIKVLFKMIIGMVKGWSFIRMENKNKLNGSMDLKLALILNWKIPKINKRLTRLGRVLFHNIRLIMLPEIVEWWWIDQTRKRKLSQIAQTGRLL